MSTDTCTPSWIARRPARWSMPVSLQPRVPPRCRIVQTEDKRPVGLSPVGCRLRPNGNYQLEIAVAEETHAPKSLSVVAGPLRRANDEAEQITQDGRLVLRYDLRFARDDEGVHISRCWWSRLQPLIVRLEYADGRDDYEHMLPLTVTPRRLWALWALLSSALLYGLVPWLSRTILDTRDLPAAWSRVFEVLARPSVWYGLMLVIFGVWLLTAISDRLQLWLRTRTLRREAAHDVRQCLERLNGTA